jgi:glutaminyl-tRNA synthetase
MTGELWIEREDFMETPTKGYFRLFPGNQVRLKYGFVVRCTGYSKDASGRIDEVHCDYLPETKSGTPGSEAVKVKGTIHWVSAAHAHDCEVRLYDRLFREPQPGTGTHDYLDDVNPNARKVMRAHLELSLKQAKPEERFQFERHGYFVGDRRDSADAQVFNRTVTLRDSWGAGKS